MFSITRMGFWMIPSAGLLSLLFLFALPSRVFWITDCAAKYLTTVNIEQKDFKDCSIDYPGAPLDPGFKANPIPDPLSVVKEKKLYSYYPPLFPFLAAPLYALFGYYGLFILPLAGALACLGLALKIASLSGLSRFWSALYGAAVFACTPCLFYTFCYWEHTLANAGVLLSIYLLIKQIRGGPRSSLFYSGLVMGLATGLREEFILLSAALFLALLLDRAQQKKRVFLFLGGKLAGLMPVWIFQYWAVGNPLGFHVANNLNSSDLFSRSEGGQIWMERMKVAGDLLANISSSDTITFVFVLGFTGLALFLLLERKQRMGTALTMTLFSIILAFSSLLIFFQTADTIEAWFNGDGFIMHGALILPGLAGFLYRKKETSARIVRLLRNGSLLFIVLLCLTAPPLTITGLHWGPRLFLPVFPILLLPTFLFFSSLLSKKEEAFGLPIQRIGLYTGLALLLGVCAATQFYSLSVLKKKLDLSDRISKQVMSLPEKVVVSNVWWFSQDMAGIFYEKTFLFAGDKETHDSLVDAMKEQGEEGYLYVAWDQEGTRPDWRLESPWRLFKLNLNRRRIE
jgi:hypothetical protein